MLTYDAFVAQYQATCPQACFGINCLRERTPKSIEYAYALDSSWDAPESFRITKTSGGYRLVGSDSKGLMYGAFELAERLIAGETPDEVTMSPAVKTRGMYQFIHNKACDERWYYSKAYWDGYFDMLAENRYNSFNLVFSHQTYYLAPIYAYLFGVKEYPEIYPDDVTAEDIRKNYDMLQYISRRAADRGIDFILGVWEVRAWKSGKDWRPNQICPVQGITDENITQYTYLAVKKLLREFPSIRGFQLRINEESGIPRGLQTDFFTNSFFKAIAEADRPVLLDYRGWGANEETTQNAIQMCPDMRVSVKYWGEFMGAPYQPAKIVPGYSYSDYLRKPMPYDFIWQVWSLGNPRILLWGDPEYGRRFVESLSLGGGSGFEICAQLAQKGYGNLSGNFSLLKNAEDEYYEHEYQRFWMFYMVFGRLSYDPQLADTRFTDKLAQRLGAQAANQTLRGYINGSRIMNFMIQYSLSDLNMYTWPEIDTAGLLEYYLDTPTSDQCVISGISEYVDGKLSNTPKGKFSPPEASDYYSKLADQLLECCRDMEAQMTAAPSKELKSHLVDFYVMAYMGKFHSKKILAAMNLDLFKKSKNYDALLAAEGYLNEALPYYEQIILITQDYYSEDMIFAPIDNGHWKKCLILLYEDILRLRSIGDIFLKYGHISAGFDFGATSARFNADNAADGMPIMRNYPVERGFTGVDGDCAYTAEQGYGFVAVENLKTVQMPPVRLSDRHLDDLRRDANFQMGQHAFMGYRGPLYNDFVQGTGDAQFRVDLENGSYEATLILCDRSGRAVPHGPLTAALGGKTLFDCQVVEPVRLYESSCRLTVSTGSVILDISGQGDWILTGLVLRRCEPVVSHLPIGYCKDAEVTIAATATAPDGIVSVMLTTDIGIAVAMEKDMGVYHTVLQNTGAVRYSITATDSAGNQKHSGPYLLTRTDKPSNFQLNCQPPVQCKAGEALTITAAITTAHPIARATLHYSQLNQYIPMEAADMLDTPQGWTAAIPGDYIRKDCDILYYIEVVDILGNGCQHPDFLTERPYFVAATE